MKVGKKICHLWPQRKCSSWLGRSKLSEPLQGILVKGNTWSISSSSLFPSSLLHLVIYSVLTLNHDRGLVKSDVTSLAHRDPKFLQLLFHSLQDASVWIIGQLTALCFSYPVQEVGAIYLLLFSDGDTCSSPVVERWESIRKQSEDFFRSNRDVKLPEPAR